MSDQDAGKRAPFDLIVVEDSTVDAELTADTLREAGLAADVRRVEGEPAFRAALDERLPDAILADWTLPHFSGQRALEIARERCPEVPFIFVSGTISETSALEALRQGATDYVYKNQLQQLGPALIRAVNEARALRLLHESEQKFMQLFMRLPIPLGVVNKDGGIAYLNDRFTEVFGYTTDDVPTLKEWWQLAYPDESYRQRVMESWGATVDKAAKEGKDIESAEYRVTCKSGAERIVLIGGTTFEGSLLATFIDITERRQAENKLNEQIGELRRWHEATLGREMRTIEVKREVNKLLAQAGQPPRYPSAE